MAVYETAMDLRHLHGTDRAAASLVLVSTLDVFEAAARREEREKAVNQWARSVRAEADDGDALREALREIIRNADDDDDAGSSGDLRWDEGSADAWEGAGDIARAALFPEVDAQ